MSKAWDFFIPSCHQSLGSYRAVAGSVWTPDHWWFSHSCASYGCVLCQLWERQLSSGTLGYTMVHLISESLTLLFWDHFPKPWVLYCEQHRYAEIILSGKIWKMRKGSGWQCERVCLVWGCHRHSVWRLYQHTKVAPQPSTLGNLFILGGLIC